MQKRRRKPSVFLLVDVVNGIRPVKHQNPLFQGCNQLTHVYLENGRLTRRVCVCVCVCVWFTFFLRVASFFVARFYFVGDGERVLQSWDFLCASVFCLQLFILCQFSV